METAGNINVYVCRGCGFRHVTVNRAEGVTPFMIGCRNPAEPSVPPGQRGISSSTGCGHMAESSFYKVDQSLAADYEWYRPEGAELDELESQTRGHVDRGGLLLRAVGEDTIPKAAPASAPTPSESLPVPVQPAPATTPPVASAPRKPGLLARLFGRG